MLVGLDNVPVILTVPVPVPPPVIPPVTVGADQLYNVPAGTIPLVILVGVTVNVTPVHVTVVIAVTAATGFNVIVTVNAVPTPQLTDVGVTI